MQILSSNTKEAPVEGEANAVSEEMTTHWLETRLPTILSNYSLADICNADEFGLFYQALPSETMHFKDEKCVGGKFSKQTLSRLTAGNALGQKLPMFIIGKANKPRCFKNLKHLPCDLFEEWVLEQDRKFECENRKILSIVDNCHAYPQIGGLKAIEMCFLPPNITSITQPIDQGVIRSLKTKYRSRMIQQSIKAIDAKKSVINCFTKFQITPQDQTSAQDDLDDPFIELRNDLEKFKLLGVDEYPEGFHRKSLQVLMITLPQQSLCYPTSHCNEIEVPIKVENDEEDGGDEDISLEKPTSIQLSSVIETLLDFSFFAQSDEVQRCILEVSKLIEEELAQGLKQASIKDYLS